MRLIKGFLAGLVLAGIPAMMPAAAFAHGGGGHGFRGGGGGHAFVGGGGHVSLLTSGTAATPPVQSGSDQDFYQPPRDPQFNTARDQ